MVTADTGLDNLRGIATEFAELMSRPSAAQVRQLRERVDNITESITPPRIRDLLHSVLLLYDLVESMAVTAEPGSVYAQNYQVLRDQILQLLRINGISPIPETQRFDPHLHKALETVACTEPEEDGLIAASRSAVNRDKS